MPQLKDRARDGERHGKRESSQDETKHCPKKKKKNHSVRDRTKYFIPLRKSRAPEMNGSRNLLTVSSISNSCVFPFVTPSLFFFLSYFHSPLHTPRLTSCPFVFPHLCLPAPPLTCLTCVSVIISCPLCIWNPVFLRHSVPVLLCSSRQAI